MIVSQQLADTRRWAFYEIGAQMCAADTGAVHGPAPQPAAQPGAGGFRGCRRPSRKSVDRAAGVTMR